MKKFLIIVIVIISIVFVVRYIDRHRMKAFDASYGIIVKQLQKEASESGAQLIFPDMTSLQYQQSPLLLPTFMAFGISGNNVNKQYVWVVFDYKRDKDVHTWDIVDLKRVYPAFSRMKESERYMFPANKETRQFHERFLALPLGYGEIMPVLSEAATRNANGGLRMSFFVEDVADKRGVPLLERVGDD